MGIIGGLIRGEDTLRQLPNGCHNDCLYMKEGNAQAPWGHPEIDGYSVIRLQSSSDQGSLTQTAQNVGVNVGVTRVLTGKVSPVQSIWVCLKRTPPPFRSNQKIKAKPRLIPAWMV